MSTPIVSSSAKKQNRKPNSECVICKKPLYRRPFELKKVRYVACMEHREIASRKFGATKAQEESLKLGRQKGTNHLEGIPKSEESKRKRSKAMKEWASNNPEATKARGEKNKGENHYNWKGGLSNFGQSLRQMTEYRKWAEAVKDRDRQCMRCKSVYNLDSHHIKPLGELITELNIKTREDTFLHADVLWDIDNGITLCKECHCREHGTIYVPPKEGRRYTSKIKIGPLKGSDNPNWKGGPVKKICLHCGIEFLTKWCLADKRKYCSKKCDNDSRKRVVQ